MSEIPRATIIIPTHDHGELIRYAIESVLSQTLGQFELFIVGDGMSDPGRACVREYERRDSRVRLFDFPKGERHGERYRHELLSAHARGSFVCYLSDDDLFTPLYLARMENNLRDHTFSHPLGLYVTASGAIGLAQGNLAIESIRHRLLGGTNFMPFSGVCHTLEFYRRLPHGWRPAPIGVPTDLYMWQQMIRSPDCKPYSDPRVSMVHFPSPERGGWSFERRLAELEEWSARVGAHDFEVSIAPHIVEFYHFAYAERAEKTRQVEEQLVESNARATNAEAAAAAHAAQLDGMRASLGTRIAALHRKEAELTQQLSEIGARLDDERSARNALRAERDEFAAQSAEYLALIRRIEQGYWFRFKRAAFSFMPSARRPQK
jgi:glycosyltransferase involved in cell wall biosynthesis